MRDPTVYGPDADQFNPERFMLAPDKLNTDIPFPEAAFGFGRRLCAGRDSAEATMWITIASLLSCFNFTKKKEDMNKDSFGGHLSGLLS